MRGTGGVAAGAAAAVVLLGSTLLTGCGDDLDDLDGDALGSAPAPETSSTSQTPSSDAPVDPPTTSAATLPACDEVWVAGTSLPRGYRGCADGDTTIRADKHPCSFGSPIITFGTSFYALANRSINEVDDLDSSADYRQALSACQA